MSAAGFSTGKWNEGQHQAALAGAFLGAFYLITATGSTGLGFITSHRLRAYEVKKLRYPACSRLENVIFSPHILATNGK